MENIAEPIFSTAKKCKDKHSTPICPDSKLSVWDFSIIITYMMRRHNWTYNGTEDILFLFSLALPKVAEEICKSVYSLRNSVTKVYPSENRKFCASCEDFVVDAGTICLSCNKEDNIKEFMIFPIDKQIKIIFESENFRTMAFKHLVHSNIVNKICSIRDGSVFKNQVGHNNHNNDKFTLCYYADGVNLYNNTKRSIWVLFLVINELPSNERYKIGNIILLGLWYNNSKPNFNIFLRPFADIFNDLAVNGINIDYSENERLVSRNIKFVLLNGHGDSPARSEMFNMKQFNGNFGCLFCYQNPKQPKDAKGNIIGKKLVYLYEENIPLRSSQNVKKIIDLMAKDKSIKCLMGVKGCNIFSELLPTSFIESMGIDAMHCIFSGVVKKLMEFWFGYYFRESQFSLHNKLTLVDSYLSMINFPSFISKSPRSIKESFSYFSTIEFKNWFYYYSLPVLSVIKMPRERLTHYYLLVKAIFLLNQDAISYDDVELSRILLNEFVKDFALNYGQEHMSSNVHALTHLADCVLRLGPLYEIDCFPKENLNGQLKDTVNGSRFPHWRMHELVSVSQKMPHYIESVSDEARAIINKISSRGKTKKSHKIFDHCYVIDANFVAPDKEHSKKIQNTFKDCNTVQGHNLLLFSRLLLNGTIYHSEQYKRAQRTYAKCVQYTRNDKKHIGIIECFFRMNYCQCHAADSQSNIKPCICQFKGFALIRKGILSCIAGLELNDFANRISISDDLCIVNVVDICTMCAFIDLEGDMFCSVRVNTKELE